MQLFICVNIGLLNLNKVEKKRKRERNTTERDKENLLKICRKIVAIDFKTIITN